MSLWTAPFKDRAYPIFFCFFCDEWFSVGENHNCKRPPANELMCGAWRVDAEREERMNPKKKSVIYHRRLPFTKVGGNSFYKDKRVQNSATYCGSDCTGYDVFDSSQMPEWNNGVIDFAPCPKCQLRQA